MRPVLAYQFAVADRHGKPGVHSELKALVVSWVQGWYRRRRIEIVESTLTGLGHAPMPGHMVRMNLSEVSATQGNWELVWEYPSDDDTSVLWRTEARIAWDPDGVDFGVVLAVASREFTIRPFRYEVYAPKAIATLVEAFHCTTEARTISRQPNLVTLDGVPSFVDQALRAQRRRLPVVLVSRVHRTNEFLVDPNKLAVQLAGLAEVWALNDKWTAFALTRVLGARHSCFDGALRIYWPGFTRESQPYDHPLVLRKTLELDLLRGGDPGRTIFRQIAPIAGLRYTDSARFLSNRAQHIAGERLKQEALLATATKAQLESVLLEQMGKHYELEGQVVDLTKRNSDLINELAAVKQGFATVAGAVASTSNPTLAGAGVRPDPVSVSQALEFAAEERPVLLPWDSAQEAAAASQYARPMEVYEALIVIAEVGEKYFDQKETGEALGRLDLLFQARGQQYAPMDSQTTTNKYGNDRTFSQDGEKLMFKRHLTLGGGDRKNCLQIYFEFDDSSGLVSIGYCGVHLRYDGMRS